VEWPTVRIVGTSVVGSLTGFEYFTKLSTGVIRRGTKVGHKAIVPLESRCRYPAMRGQNVTTPRRTGGEAGIRTQEPGITRLTAFEAVSFDHSDTSPRHLLRLILADFSTPTNCLSFGSKKGLKYCNRF